MYYQIVDIVVEQYNYSRYNIYDFEFFMVNSCYLFRLELFLFFEVGQYKNDGNGRQCDGNLCVQN